METMCIDIFNFRLNQWTHHERINYGYRRDDKTSQKLAEGHEDRIVVKEVERNIGVLIYPFLKIIANTGYLLYAHSKR